MDPTELVDLELSEVSLVDTPANKSAVIALFKRDDDMNKEEIEKLKADIEAVTTKNTELTVDKQQLEAQVSDLTKKLEGASFVEKGEDTIEIDGEKITKSSIPASVLKKLEVMQDDVAKSIVTKRVTDTIPNFVGTAAQKIKLIKSVGEDQDLLNLLKTADKLFAKSFDEVGKTDADGDLMIDPNEKLNKMAEVKSKEKNITFQKAYAEVVRTTEGQALIKELRKN